MNWKNIAKPCKRLLASSGSASSGRNSAGRITIFHRGGGSKRQHRNVDLKRNTSATGIVERIEYDPNRSSKIALVRWIEGVEPNKPIQKFTAPKVSTTDPIAATVSARFPLGCLSPRLMRAGAALSATSISNSVGSKGKFSSLKDVFSSGLASGRAKQLSSSLNFPRIAVAGAKPGFFVAEPRGELEAEIEKDFSLSEIKKWKKDSVLWDHRSKRKAAFSWQSIVRNEISLGFVRDDDKAELKSEMGDKSSPVKRIGRRSMKYGNDCAPVSYILASNELEAGSMVMNCDSSKSSKNQRGY